MSVHKKEPLKSMILPSGCPVLGRPLMLGMVTLLRKDKSKKCYCPPERSTQCLLRLPRLEATLPYEGLVWSILPVPGLSHRDALVVSVQYPDKYWFMSDPSPHLLSKSSNIDSRIHCMWKILPIFKNLCSDRVYQLLQTVMYFTEFFTYTLHHLDD